MNLIKWAAVGVAGIFGAVTVACAIWGVGIAPVGEFTVASKNYTPEHAEKGGVHNGRIVAGDYSFTIRRGNEILIIPARKQTWDRVSVGDKLPVVKISPNGIDAYRHADDEDFQPHLYKD